MAVSNCTAGSTAQSGLIEYFLPIAEMHAESLYLAGFSSAKSEEHW